MRTNDMTVSMPLNAYEKMQADIDMLTKESVRNYIEREYSDFKKNEYVTHLDITAIQKDLGLELIIK